MSYKKININGILINTINYDELIFEIKRSIKDNKKIIINYVNANTINISYKDKHLAEYLAVSHINHPDGIGIKFASNILFGKSTLKNRFTGSDFYPLLINECRKNNYSLFFFGHDSDTLNSVNTQNAGLNISGTFSGFGFETDEVIQEIDKSKAEILIIGLGTPKQEQWVYENYLKINCNVILTVGEGIKVFAGTKRRGPEFLRKFGFEWFYRLIKNPLKYFNRYIIGNPLFIYRIIKLKMRILAR